MINDPASVQDGVRTMRHLSPVQIFLTVLIWLGFFGAIAVLVSIRPNDDGTIGALILGMMVLVFGGMFIVARRPRGREYQMIVGTAGVRGDFRVRRVYPLLATWICLLFAFVCVNGMLSEPPKSNAIWGWALTGIAFLIVYAIILIHLRRVVVGFRFDDDGRVWVRRRGQAWKPLRVSDYRRAHGRVVSGRGGSAPSQIDFLQPIDDAKPIRIPLLAVRSETHGSPVAGLFISGFFQDLVRKSGWQVESKRDGGWKATNPNSL